ncbi:L-threonylcarbamoyladenylate synthase [Tsuneonella sp. HG249]
MTDKRATERLTGDVAGVARAAALLESGALVALPTETVYGLAARADRAESVAAIYRAKGRPDFNPLIVHVLDATAAARLAIMDERARLLADRFWPGPLTLVLPQLEGAEIAPAVTAGLPSIALRCPGHPVMRAVLEANGLSLAAPSANRSGSVSPTSADHVVSGLGGRIDAVLDGGVCPEGLESTIVALRTEGWQLLREGPIARETIVSLMGEPLPVVASKIEAPGQLAQHYSPGKPVRLEAYTATLAEFFVGFGSVRGDCTLSSSGDLHEAASRLYECLHQAAASDKPRVAVAPVPNRGVGRAINDRLRRSAA